MEEKYLSERKIYMAFEKYQDLWSLKENSYRRLERDKAVIIFMDCKDVTGNHARYHLMGKDPVYRAMAESAMQVAEAENLTCTVYAGIDEAMVIFPDSGELYDRFRVDDCADYVLALYMQRFLKFFWQRYPDIFVKNMIFNLPFKDTGRFLSYRREVCQTVAAFYQAKEHLEVSRYKDLPFAKETILQLLKEQGLYEELANNRDFYNGILMEHKAHTFLSVFTETFT